ncbi:MAG: hypothetical protein K5796_02010 [Lachnospiraceae bacterium]|jgi:hypothetical protein|nr:hypothetical protein [Lachnospiraceae bacterium]
MGIGPLELSGAISRTQDFAVIKQHEDNKGAVDQANIMQSARKEEEEKANYVNVTDEVSNYNKKFDAKEKGNNEYHGDGGKHREKQPEHEDGKVTIKRESTFDIRI